MWFIALCASTVAATITGNVRQSGDGDPIEQVDITRGTQTLATTSTDGSFSIDVSTFPVDLQFTSMAHSPLTLRLEGPSQETLAVYLTVAPAPYEIIVESFQRSDHVSRQAVDAEMAYETPGALDDSVRLVQALPGVSVQREYAPGGGDIMVRGSLPGNNRYLFDGIEIPYLYHFGQYASVLPSSQLKDLTLYPSSFGASFGDAVGGIIDAHSKTEQPKIVHGDLMVNVIMAGGSIRVPLKDNWWLSASGRRSYQDTTSAPTDQYTVWPRFFDYNVRATHAKTDSTTNLYIWGAKDSYTRAISELDVLNPYERTEVPTLDFKRAFNIVGIRHLRHPDANTTALSLAFVDDLVDGALSNGLGEVLVSRYLSGRLEQALNTGIGDLTLGVTTKIEKSILDADDVGDAALDVAAELPALAENKSVFTDTYRAKTGIYTSGKFGGRLQVNPGARVSLDSLAEKTVLIDPRLAIHYRHNDETAIKFGGGRYHQAPTTEALLVSEDALPTASSWQITGGVERTIANRLELTVEAYQKWLSDVVIQPLGEPITVIPTSTATGIEFVTRYRLRETVFFWAWVSVNRAQMRYENHDIPTDSDQPIMAGLVVSWDPSDAWNVGARYRYGSGLPYTPLNGAVYQATTDSWTPITAPENSGRYPTYQKLDLHVARTWQFNRWSLSATAETWIVPKSSAQLYPVYNYDASEEGWVSGPTFFPIIGARATF